MRTWIKALLAGTLALGPAAAMAAIDNTHHDMIYLGASTERCAYCHSKVGLTSSAVPLGKVGNFCVQVCHLTGTGIETGGRSEVVPTSPGNYSQALGVFTMANNGGGPGNIDTNILVAHGFTPTVLDGLAAAPGTVEKDAVAATGWPYTTAGSDMQCTSCHAVHDATNPPFLNAKLAAAGATAQADNFCARCHALPGRVQDFTAAGNHPTEFEWDPAAAALRTVAKTGDAATIQNRREILVGAAITNLNVKDATLADDAPVNALNATTAIWDMGGHVINPATGLPQSGRAGTNAENVGCYSCHMVHQSNTVASPYGTALLVGNQLSDVCHGCHTSEPGTSTYGHPIDEDPQLNEALGWPALTMSPGYIAINATFYKNTAVNPKGENSPWCVTCHDVHEAATGRMAIRVIDTKAAYAATDSVCEQCHSTGATNWANPTVANAHHPGSTTLDYTAAANGGFPATISWATADGLGDLADGLTCGDCHIGDGTTAKRATAHNWN